MKKICFILILFCLFAADSFCQMKELSVDSVYKYHVNKFLIKQDSLIKVYADALIEVRRFYIKIDKVFFDKASKEFRMSGRVCFTKDTLNCVGIPSVGVYKVKKGDDNIITSWIQVGESSYDKSSSENDGFFDIQFNIEKQESLLFSIPFFYLEEFKLSDLLNE